MGKRVEKIKLGVKRIRNSKISNEKNVRVLLSELIAVNEKEKKFIEEILGLFRNKPDNIISTEEISSLRKRLEISKTGSWRTIKRLEALGVLESIIRVDKKNFYLLSPRLDKALYKLARAYRKLRKKDV